MGYTSNDQIFHELESQKLRFATTGSPGSTTAVGLEASAVPVDLKVCWVCYYVFSNFYSNFWLIFGKL